MLLGLDTVQDHANHALQFRIFRLAALHEPAEHVLILARQQTHIQIAIHLVQRRVNLLHERHQQHVKLKHAATAVPKEAIQFNLFDHGALLKFGGKYTAPKRVAQSALVGHHRSFINYPFQQRTLMMCPRLFTLRRPMADSAFFCTLSHEGVLAVRGADAGKFLQGQLTCNLNYLSDSRASLGARCTQKGRMQSSFRILLESDGVVLAMASELLEPQLADLKKYAVFSKSKLTDESAAWVRFGLEHGDSALTSLGLDLPTETDSVVRNEGLIAIRVSPHRAELWVPADQADAIKTKLAAILAQGELNQWLLGQIRAGIGQVMPSTRELFIPQMLNLQAVGGVSFKKGCYTGQEIVARMQYLGKLKRRLYRLSLNATELPEPGTQLFAPSHNSAIGEVVLAASAGENIELLAVLQAEAAEAGDLHLGALEGPALHLLDLPYELDRDREIQR